MNSPKDMLNAGQYYFLNFPVGWAEGQPYLELEHELNAIPISVVITKAKNIFFIYYFLCRLFERSVRKIIVF